MCPDQSTLALASVALAMSEFDCTPGDPTSYHTTENGEKHRYVTLGFISPSLADAAIALCNELCRARKSMSRPLLYVRSPPQIAHDGGLWSIRMRVASPDMDWRLVTTKPEGLPFPKV